MIRQILHVLRRRPLLCTACNGLIQLPSPRVLSYVEDGTHDWHWTRRYFPQPHWTVRGYWRQSGRVDIAFLMQDGKWRKAWDRQEIIDAPGLLGVRGMTERSIDGELGEVVIEIAPWNVGWRVMRLEACPRPECKVKRHWQIYGYVETAQEAEEKAIEIRTYPDRNFV